MWILRKILQVLTWRRCIKERSKHISFRNSSAALPILAIKMHGAQGWDSRGLSLLWLDKSIHVYCLLLILIIDSIVSLCLKATSLSCMSHGSFTFIWTPQVLTGLGLNYDAESQRLKVSTRGIRIIREMVLGLRAF